MSDPTLSAQNASQWRAWLMLGALLGALSVLLLLDWRAQGLVWRFVWSQTGEESVPGQVRGMLELGGNLLRPQPQTQPLTPIDHADGVPYGINVFLQKEVEIPKIEEQLRMIREAGFVWLRQEFPWEDLEVDGRGQFTDTRNDYDGDGEPDTINAWDKYDRIVDLTEEYGLRLLVRLSNPPNWARSDPNSGDFAPPDDFQDFVHYAVAVAERYQGRITHYQIWNEPNIYPEWGEAFADPVAYTDLLCRTYDALKAVDPDIVVLSGAIAPTISLDGFFGYADLLYLQTMYDHGAADCFDVLSAQGYGLFSGPTDRRLRLTSVNVQRHVYYRDLMVANGDAHKPIWLSEAAWNPVLDAALAPAQIADFNRFGTVTLAQAARYMPQMYERAQREWPWIGQVSYWFFTRPDDSEINQSFFYFRMVEPDYSPDKPTFTPLPVYDAMREHITTQTPTLYRGVHQAESWEIEADNAERVPAEGAQFDEALIAERISFHAVGTGVRIRLADGAAFTLERDGERLPYTLLPDGDGWQRLVPADDSLIASQTHRYTLSASGGEPLRVDAVIVYDQTWAHLLPLLVVGVSLAVVVALALIIARR